MTIAKFKKILNERLKIENDSHDEFLILRKIMIQFEGKKLTKNVNKKLPDGFNLIYDVNGPSIQGPKLNHFLCYSYEQNDFKIAFFDKRNAPYNSGAKDRAEKLENILNNPDLFNEYMTFYKHYEKLVKSLNAIHEMKSPSFNNPAHFYIKSEIFDLINDKYEREGLEQAIH